MRRKTQMDAMYEVAQAAIASGEIDKSKAEEKMRQHQCYYCASPMEFWATPRLLPCCRDHSDKVGEIENRVLGVEGFGVPIPPPLPEQNPDDHTGEVYLSSVSWGDFPPIVWRGDLSRPDADIISECKRALSHKNSTPWWDVDHPNQTDAQILAKIDDARATLRKAQDDARQALANLHDIEAEAKRTGHQQVVDSWVTDRCHNHSEGCSFDSAVMTVDARGRYRIRYFCCY